MKPLSTIIAAMFAGTTLVSALPAPAQQLPLNAATRPQRNVTSFDEGLRCMDQTLLRFGTRDVSVMLEEIPDKTGRSGAGTRDMMVSAMSDMTKRSRAVKLVAFGFDNQNVVGLLSTMQRQNQFNLVPQYDIRGALSQFDTDAARQQSSVGISLVNLFGFKASRDRSVSVLGFDASVIQTSDLTLMNGVSSKNAMVIVRDDRAGDGSATIQKVGIEFNTSFTRQDSAAQAVRNLIELASIELVGKLTKVPYWSCLGMPLDSPEVGNEIEDWFVGFRNPRDMNAFMQEQLRNRGFYDGPVDGRPNPALKQAIAAYGRALGVRTDGRIDLEYFRAFLLQDAPAAPDEPFSVADLQPDKLGELTVKALTTDAHQNGTLEIEVSSSVSAYVYCYTQAADGKIQRFFPNRFARDPRIEADKPLQLPGKQPFALRANAAGDAHRIACISAAREIYGGLPPQLRWSDFSDIGFTNFDDVRQAFANATETPISMAELTIPLRGSAATGQPGSVPGVTTFTTAAPVGVPVDGLGTIGSPVPVIGSAGFPNGPVGGVPGATPLPSAGVPASATAATGVPALRIGVPSASNTKK